MTKPPWRKVVLATIVTNHAWLSKLPGRVGGHHWVLTLECGHERTRQLSGWATPVAELASKPPKKALCWACRNVSAGVST